MADDGYFIAQVNGDIVSSVEGIGSASDWQRLKDARNVQAASTAPSQIH